MLNRLNLLAATCSLVLLMTVMVAAVPPLISYQGRLTDASGQPVDTTVDLTFRIWDSAASGVSVWWETQPDIVVINGLFNVNLGAVESFGPIFTGETLYLTVKMPDGTESEPRIPMISAPYALVAQHADTATYALSGPGSGTVGWVDDGTVIRLDNEDDSVGIGTSYPGTKLDVVSDATSIRGSTNSDDHAGVLGMSGGGTGVYGFSLTGTGVHGFSSTGFGGYFDGPVGYFSSRLGIGVESPLAALDITQSSDEVCLHFSDGTRDITWMPTHALQFGQWDGATWTERMRISSNGNVGIGVTNPSARLDVDGSTEVNGDLKVTGAYKGNISSTTSSDGAPFPRPAFDTTIAVAPEVLQVVRHDIGGDARNYFVDMQFVKNDVLGTHIRRLGGDFFFKESMGYNWYGAYWKELNDSAITIYVEPSEENIDSVVVRIWVIE